MTLSKIYFWLFDKVNINLQVYAVTKNTLQKMHVLVNEKRLLVVEPSQLI